MDWVERRTGIVRNGPQRMMLHNRLIALVGRGFGGQVERLVQALSSRDEAAQDQVVELALVQHTAFYREHETLGRAIDEGIMPRLKKGKVRIWSAAAASGEEAYTTLMMIAERAGRDAPPAELALLGTDIGRTGLRDAERGLYSASRMAPLPESYRRHFEPAGLGLVRIAQAFRDAAVFRRLNLLQESWPFKRRFDVIFCRNVFYYFSPRRQATLIQRLHQYIEPGGWLVTSVTEHVGEHAQGYQFIAPGLLRKAGA